MFARIGRLLSPLLLALAFLQAPAQAAAPAAQTPAPVLLVQHLTDSVMDAARSDPRLKAGDASHIEQLVQTKVLPYLDFERMTASAVGPFWRRATPQQRQELQQQFKELLIHTYSHAIREIGDQKVQ